MGARLPPLLQAALCLLAALCSGGRPGNAAADTNSTHQLCRLGLPAPPAAAHKLAVIIPYRNRPQQLKTAVQLLHSFLRSQGRVFDIFILQQSRRLRFNRGLLFNAGFLLLDGSDYDHFCIHDVDTLPTREGSIPYSYPAGKAPYHLVPAGIHPWETFENYAGGNIIFAREQLRAVNGFGVHFWGWGKRLGQGHVPLMLV